MHASDSDFRLDANSVTESRERVYGYMLRTRKEKYEPWIKGIKRYKRWALIAERYLVPIGAPYFKDASLRVEMIEAIYIAMRLVDDVVDKDAPLPEEFSSSVAYVESAIAFVAGEHDPSTLVEGLLAYALDIGQRLEMDIRAALMDILRSLLFDAERQGSPKLQIFDRETLGHHFRMLDIRGTIVVCLVATREPIEAWKTVEPLGEATRIWYNLRDLEEDARANLCNIPREDVAEFGIRDVSDIDSPEMRRWRLKEAERGLILLRTYRQRKKEVDLHIFTRTILLLAYEMPTEKHLVQVKLSA